MSGREPIDKGFGDDVDLAAALDINMAVPCWKTTDPIRQLTTGTA